MSTFSTYSFGKLAFSLSVLSVFLFCIECVESILITQVLSLFKRILCNIVCFLETHQTIYKNSVVQKQAPTEVICCYIPVENISK